MIPWYKSKQFWFNVLAVITAIAAGFGFDDTKPDPTTMIIAQLGIALINVVLRFAFPSKPPPPTATPKSAAVPARDYTRINRQAAFWTVFATSAALLIGSALTL